ncbi:MAG: isoprenylcysteine carboxylmethyltransferase family protein [Kiritimatiellaeota bacterium]|nr:isoprenylcysteine carboxylmethyltransferase family protein [Kiritimatiellota bacterium]
MTPAGGTSWLLVAAQVALAVTVLVPGGSFSWQPAGVGLVVGGGLLGLWALTVNRPGNFRIVPDLKPGAHLVQTGPYRWIRHPMYTAVLLLTLGGLLCQWAPLRMLAWLALGAVLYAKAAREERLLTARFPGYAAYQARTRRFLPGGPRS